MATPLERYLAAKNGIDEFWSVVDLATGEIAKYRGTLMFRLNEAEAHRMAAKLNDQHRKGPLH